MFQLRIDPGLAIIALLQLWILVRIIHDKNNLIIWSDFISTRGTDGKQHGDADKLGQLCGIGLVVVTIFMYADNDKVDPLGLAALLGVGLAYLGSVKAYSSYLRAKANATTSGTTTTSTVDSTSTTTTKP